AKRAEIAFVARSWVAKLRRAGDRSSLNAIAIHWAEGQPPVYKHTPHAWLLRAVGATQASARSADLRRAPSRAHGRSGSWRAGRAHRPARLPDRAGSVGADPPRSRGPGRARVPCRGRGRSLA